jgi:hypothetical protein
VDDWEAAQKNRDLIDGRGTQRISGAVQPHEQDRRIIVGEAKTSVGFVGDVLSALFQGWAGLELVLIQTRL